MPYLRCLSLKEAQYAIAEVHEGICGQYVGGRALSQKILRQGYYWPRMLEDCLAYVRRCEQCQLYSPVLHQSPTEMVPIVSPWPFAQWGIDIIGPFPEAPGRKKFAVVAVDYFTKWVEVEALTGITHQQV